MKERVNNIAFNLPTTPDEDMPSHEYGVTFTFGDYSKRINADDWCEEYGYFLDIDPATLIHLVKYAYKSGQLNPNEPLTLVGTLKHNDKTKEN